MALQQVLAGQPGAQATGPGGSATPGAPAVPAPQAIELPDYDPKIVFKSEAERDALGNKLTTKILHSKSVHSERFDRIRQFRNQYAATSFPKDTPWPNAASLNIPTTWSAVETMHADIVSAMAGTTPLFRLQPYSSKDQADTMNVQHLLQWQMTNQIEIHQFFDEGVKGALLDGNAIGLIDWRREQHRTRKPGYLKNDDGTHKLNPAGNPIRALVEDTDYTINQPRVTCIDVLDFCLYPPNAPTIEKAIGVGHRVWLTKNDLRRGVRDELYDKDQVDRLLEKERSPAQPNTNNEQNGGDDASLSRVGLEYADAYEADDRPFEFFQVVWQYDEDGDDINEDCFFVVEMSTGIIIRAECYPFWHNRRCYISYTPMPRKKSFFGFTVPEVLESMHSEINAIRNQRVDAGTLYLSPMLAIKRGVKFDGGKIKWRPGGTAFMDDPDKDVRPISFQNVTQTAFSEEQAAKENVEKALGISDYAMGSSPSRSRTVGEISQVSAAGNKRADALIARLHHANNEIAAQVIGLNRQFLDPETEYAITQDPERMFATFDLNALRARFRIQAQGNTVTGNKEFEVQNTETAFQMMQHEPLMQNPTRRWNVLADFFQVRGKIDPAPYIGTHQEAEAMEQQPAGPPPPAQMTSRLDEAGSLALALKEQQFTPEEYDAAAQKILAAKAEQAKLDHLKGAADTEHGAATQMGMAPQPGQAPPMLPPSQTPASPVPPQGGA